jgi:peptidoglycan hydrolase-like protein with peptidoglycan-binding domain
MNNINFSVGEGGANIPQDVAVVQFLLDVVRRRDGDERLLVDGIAGPKTLAAISQFQKKYCSAVDGRVNPAGETISALNMQAPQPPKDPLSFNNPHSGNFFA